MSDDLLFAIGVGAFVFCLGAIITLILSGILDGEREYRAASQESYAEASLRPRSGLVAVSTQEAPYDREKDAEDLEILKAQQFVWALHQIDSAFTTEWGHRPQ